MKIKAIPEGSIEIQTGLWLYEYQRIIIGNNVTLRNLYSDENYCFYDLADEYYDEDGNLIPENEIRPNQRKYYQFMGLSSNMSSWTYEQLNAEFISVPVQDGFEIVSVPNNSTII